MTPSRAAEPEPDAEPAAASRKATVGATGAVAGAAPDPTVNALPREQTIPPAAPIQEAAPSVATPPGPAAVHPAPAAPGEQLAPALLTLGKTPDGNQQMTVRLQPDQLGMVQIRIERAPSGSTQVTITAEQPDTLQALQHDQPRLHQMLSEAGIPAAGRSITFHAAQPVQASAAGNPAGQGGGPPTSFSRAAGTALDAGGSAAGGGRNGYPPRDTGSAFGGRRQSGSAAVPDASVATTNPSYRIGLNITA